MSAILGRGDAAGSHGTQGETRVLPPNAGNAWHEGLSGDRFSLVLPCLPGDACSHVRCGLAEVVEGKYHSESCFGLTQHSPCIRESAVCSPVYQSRVPTHVPSRPFFVVFVFEGAHAGQAEPAQGDLHGDSHVRGATAGVGTFVHPQLACGDRCQVGSHVMMQLLLCSTPFR